MANIVYHFTGHELIWQTHTRRWLYLGREQKGQPLLMPQYPPVRRWMVSKHFRDNKQLRKPEIVK